MKEALSSSSSSTRSIRLICWSSASETVWLMLRKRKSEKSAKLSMFSCVE